MKRLLPFLLLPLVSAAAPAGDPQTFTGHYVVDWEVQAFRSCDGAAFWVANPGPLMRVYRDLVRDAEYGSVFVTVRAEVSEPGRFGHMGRYRRTMAVREVVEARAAGDDDCARRETE